MLPDTIIDELFGGLVRYLSKRKILIFLGSLILFSPDSSQLITTEVWDSNVSEIKDLLVSFLGEIKIYQCVFLFLVIFLVSPGVSGWVFKKFFMVVVRASWQVFVLRQEVVIGKMEGDFLSEGEMSAFQSSCRLAMRKINELSVVYADCCSVVSVVCFYLVVSHVYLFFYALLFFVVFMVVLGVILARKAVWLYLDEVWPLCVILEEVEHHEKIMSLKEVVQEE